MAKLADTCRKIHYISDYKKKTVFVVADELLQYTRTSRIVSTGRLE